MYCECGCGQKTNLCRDNDATRNYVKGAPMRYLPNHHRRSSPVEYKVEDRGYTTPCWIWQRSTKEGYGVACIGKKLTRQAHVVYYERYKGPIPTGWEVDHLCRVVGCCNPDHLEAVTSAVNARRRPTTKLSEMRAGLIRAARRGGCTYAFLADAFGVSDSAIWGVLSGTRWR